MAELTARAAAKALGVSRATLYAYVSRGLIRSERGLIRSERGGGRERRYDSADVAALLRGPALAAPVIDTAIGCVRDRRLWLRGRDAVTLARDLSVREAASLIWQADPAASFAADNLPAAGAALGDFPPAIRTVAALLAFDEPPPGDEAALGLAGARLLRAMAAGIAGTAPSARPVEAVLAEAWGVDRARRPQLRAALILGADETMDAATLATRAAAGAGSGLAAAVAAGLLALPDAESSEVDARGEFLLRLIGKSHAAVSLAVARGTLAAALGLPADAASVLRQLGRAIGLIAHAAEARNDARGIVPRPRYIGVLPDAAANP